VYRLHWPIDRRGGQAKRLLVSVTPAEHTLDGLVAGLETYYSEAIEA